MPLPCASSGSDSDDEEIEEEVDEEEEEGGGVGVKRSKATRRRAQQFVLAYSSRVRCDLAVGKVRPCSFTIHENSTTGLHEKESEQQSMW